MGNKRNVLESVIKSAKIVKANSNGMFKSYHEIGMFLIMAANDEEMKKQWALFMRKDRANQY
jgi:hypothetical protein